MDGNASSLKLPHHFGDGVPAGSRVNSIVKVEQLCIGVGSVRPLEAFGDKVLDAAPDGVAGIAIVFESFVDDIISIDAPSIALY